MVLSTSLRRIAKGQITRWGRTATLKHRSSSFDTSTLTSAATELDETVKVVVTDYNVEEMQGPVEAGDRKVMLAAQGLSEPPKAEDELVIGSDTWRVVSVQTTELQGFDIAYTLQVRQ